MNWYTLNTAEIYTHLNTSEKGLTSSAADNARQQFGLNKLPSKSEPLWRKIIEPFRSVFVLVLLVAALVSVLSHEVLDAVIIGAVVFINALIFYSQEYATSRVLRSLKKHSAQQVNVYRDGQLILTSSELLVPGDVIDINEGERIAADARVIHSESLQVDESPLTGESVPSDKHSSVLGPDKQIYEQDNMVFQGTYATSGAGRAVVVNTGELTEFGKIAELSSQKPAPSPVQTKVDDLIKKIVAAVGAVAALVFILSLSRGMAAAESLRFVLALCVSAVPEGLPVALTVITVLGMRRMAKQQALVQSFKAMDDIGLVTTVATDKTGTLTKNILEVVDSWSLGSANVNHLARLTLEVDEDIFDPLDKAIVAKVPNGNDTGITKIYPFDLAIRMSGAYFSKDKTIFVKGAPEHLLSKAKLSKEQHAQAESQMHAMASKGYRVIAVGSFNNIPSAPDDLGTISFSTFDFAGFIALADELRPEALPAIQAAQTAGIHVKLITGDHYETAYNISKQLNLAHHPDDVIQGTDLPKEDHVLAQTVAKKSVFARIIPEDKYRILTALKQTEITAMTGDGVNDVPALANAHVGIAMGSGSDIARDAGGIVLLDNNFSTIIKAIAEGRKIFANIRRMLFYLFSTSLGEVLSMVGCLAFGLPLPVTAIQILWINIVTDTALVLPLGLEPAEEGDMQKPPRRPTDPILDNGLLSRVIVIALTMAIVTVAIVVHLKNQGHSDGYIQTVAFMALIAAQWMNAFNARSENKSSFSRIKKLNHGLTFGFLLALGLQWLVIFGPLQNVFDIVPVPLTVLAGYSAIMAGIILAVSEFHKELTRHTLAGQGKTSAS